LGDFKRTGREGKTTPVAQPDELSRITARKRAVSMSTSTPSLVKQLLVVAAVATLAAGEQATGSGDRAYPIPTQ